MKTDILFHTQFQPLQISKSEQVSNFTIPQAILFIGRNIEEGLVLELSVYALFTVCLTV